MLGLSESPDQVKKIQRLLLLEQSLYSFISAMVRCSVFMLALSQATPLRYLLLLAGLYVFAQWPLYAVMAYIQEKSAQVVIALNSMIMATIAIIFAINAMNIDAALICFSLVSAIETTQASKRILYSQQLAEAQAVDYNAKLMLILTLATSLGVLFGVLMFYPVPYLQYFPLIITLMLLILISMMIPDLNTIMHLNRDISFNPLNLILPLRQTELLHKALAISFYWMMVLSIELMVYWTQIPFNKAVLPSFSVVFSLLSDYFVFNLGLFLGYFYHKQLVNETLELGILPVSTIIFAVGMSCLSLWPSSILISWPVLFVVGIAAANYLIPLLIEASKLSNSAYKFNIVGHMVVFINLIVVMFFFTVSLFWITNWFNRDAIFLSFVLFSVFIAIYQFKFYPFTIIRAVVWVLTHTIMQVRVYGADNLPQKGAALLVCNHVSYIDSLVLGITTKRMIRFLLYKPIYEHKALNWFFRAGGCIPIQAGDGKLIDKAYALARERLNQGELVCIFAEGGLTRTGQMLPFKRGLEYIAKEMDVAVIPVYLDRLWETQFSLVLRKSTTGKKRRSPMIFSVSYGQPNFDEVDAWKIRQQVQELACEAQISCIDSKYVTLAHKLIHRLKTNGYRTLLIDAHGNRLSAQRCLVRALLSAEVIRRHFPEQSEIGIMMPINDISTIINFAVTIAGCVAVNIPLEMTSEQLQSIVEKGKLAVLVVDDETIEFASSVCANEVKHYSFCSPTLQQKQQSIYYYMVNFYTVSRLLRQFGREVSVNAPVAVVFSRLADETYRGIVLSHKSIIVNINIVRQVFHLKQGAIMLSQLSPDHAYGYSLSLWLPVLNNLKLLRVQVNLDIQRIGTLIKKNKISILLNEPNFYQSCLEHLSPSLLSSVKTAVVGIHGCAQELLHHFEDKFDIKLLAGYGSPEMGPAIAANIPNYRDSRILQIGRKTNSLGQPLPGVAVKVICPEKHTRLGPNSVGRFMFKSHGRMLGYWREPKIHTPFIDDWLLSQDVGYIDEDGFLFFIAKE